MKLFNLLCVNRDQGGIGNVLMIFSIISILMFLYGVITMCINFGKEEEKYKRKSKIGTVSFILSIVFTAIILFIISSDLDMYRDPCGNKGMLLSLLNSFYRITAIIIPLIFIILLLFTSIELIIEKNDLRKKELKQRIIRYIIIAILIFVMMISASLFVENMNEVSESVSWATCWC